MFGNIEDILKKNSIVSVTLSGNSAGVIEDALRSVEHQVNACILIDTGITDDTIAKARAVVGDKLHVVSHVWKNDFAEARNAALTAAEKFGANWSLIVDTDERFTFGNVSLRDFLAKTDVDIVAIQSADKSYYKEKIFRTSANVRFVGPVHETPIYKSGVALPNVYFDELPKTWEQLKAKRTRDIAALTDWVAKPENADDGRWWYYLGDSYHGMGNLEQAITAFAKCVELRKPPSEEGAWAAYRQAECLCIQNKFSEAVEVCTRGLSRYSGTAELAWLAGYAAYRAGWNDEAMTWARMAIVSGWFMGKPVERRLFINEEALYEKPFEILKALLPDGPDKKHAEELYVAARNARLGVVDAASLDRKSITRGAPHAELRPKLRPASIRRLCPSCKVIDLEPDMWRSEATHLANYHATNPSVCVHNDALKIVVRLVNYTIENGQYVTPDGKIRTENLMGTFGPDGKLTGLGLIEDLATDPRSPTHVLGYEDIRPFHVNGKLMGSATVRDRGDDRCKIALLTFDTDENIASAKVIPTPRPVEKNWMPIEGKGAPTWLYEVNTMVVRDTERASETRRCKFALDHQRGGSQVIPFDDGYLCVTHETINMEGWGVRRIYLHRFIKFDASLNVVAVSPAWVFEDGHYGIEFCAGMCKDPHSLDRLILSYGVEDRQAKLLLVEAHDIRNLQWITA